MLNSLRSVALGTVATLCLAAPAMAQTIDYGSLEQIFGEPVTNSATGKPQRASNAPVSMVIVSQDEIRRSGATNVPDILQRVVGLDVWRWTNGHADVAVRGMNSAFSPRLLVLVNGRQVYMDHFGMTAWNNLPVALAEIRQIEVVKGPNTALFGFNAVGGVVNIVTYNPLADTVSNVTVRGGTQDYRELSAVTTVKLGETLGLRLTASGYNMKEFDKPFLPADEAQRVDPKKRLLKADALWQVTPDLQVGAEVANSRSSQSEMIYTYTIYPHDEDVWSGKLTATARTDLGLIEASVYRNDLDIDIIPGVEFNNQVTVARLQDLFKIGANHSFRLSLEYRRNELANPSTQGGEIGYDVYSTAGMWDWAITDRLDLVNALRVDFLQLERTGTLPAGTPYTNADYDRDVSEFSFNSGLVFKATDQDTLRAGIARGIQLPSLFEYGQVSLVSFGDFSFGQFGDPAMAPTVVTNYELAWDRQIAAIGGSFSLAAFYQTNEDVKSAARLVAPPATFVFSNVGDTTTFGLDATLRGRFGDGWSWKAGYAFQQVDDKFDFVQNTVNFEDTTPQHKISGEIGYAAGAWEANLFGLYVSAHDNLRSELTTPVEIADYVYLAGRIGYRVLDDVQLAVSAFNITRNEAGLTSGFAEERRIYGSISLDF